jgi:hypothetical protein
MFPFIEVYLSALCDTGARQMNMVPAVVVVPRMPLFLLAS